MGVQPTAQKGCPSCSKMDSQWVGPCQVLERMRDVMYRVQLPPRGRRVALHRERLAPYKGCTLFPAQLAPGAPNLSVPSPPPQSLVPSLPSSLPAALSSPLVSTSPPVPRPSRRRRAPSNFTDFLVGRSKTACSPEG